MNKKIMIVEDSALMIAVIKKFIQKSGRSFDIIAAHSGGESVVLYKSEKPDLVFMDIRMPGMDGVTALQKIKEFDPNARVVMCTAIKTKEEQQKAEESGCVGYITKPFSEEDIIYAVNDNI
jgi:two-component system, chemotaxis family, chemotaxis protein CheY